jgi:large subunit ribosomal protein L35
MPKLKTHSGTKKRIRFTKNGKMLRGNAGTHHLLRNQSKRGKRAKVADTAIKGGVKKQLKRALGE